MKRSSPGFAARVLSRILVTPRLSGSTSPRVRSLLEPRSTDAPLTARRLGLVLSCIGTQPQRDVRRLHRLSDHSNKIFVRGIQVSFVPELGREWFEGLSRVVLSVVEAAIYESLRP